ncbi:MAG: hypothetical protein A4S16_09490 [Proteobacteria bacterium SG_bin6]|nr:MAG: hypothetical protein A4S16_09490 [Proteobacteria bacterium SG_bin6]
MLGALAGSAIAKSLDKCEREKFATATKTALDSPASGPTAQQEWTSETRKGVSGTVIANPIVKQADGRVCRSVRRVNYIDGKEMSDAPTFCQMPPDKAWTEQAA